MSKQELSADALDWSDPVSDGDALLPVGPATFEVLKLDRDQREFGKCGLVNVADLTLICTSEGDGTAGNVRISLPLHRSMQWKIFQFFTSIGQRKHGEEGPFKPNWGKVMGATGRCEIKHRDGKNGRTYNDVDKFLDPADEDDNLTI